MYFVDFFFLVGPLYVDQTVPKEKDLEREMSSEFDGWVNKGGCWRPTECQARVKVRLLATFKFSVSKHFIILLPFHIELAGVLFWNVWGRVFPLSPNIHMQILQTDIHTFPRDTVSWGILIIRTKHFLFGDHLINSHNHFSWQHMDIVGRKFMLVTVRTKRFKNMLSFRFYDIFFIMIFSFVEK